MHTIKRNLNYCYDEQSFFYVLYSLGVNLTNPTLTIVSDVLREFNMESLVIVDISVDVTSDSASVSGTDLWQFEFFTSSSPDGSAATSVRFTDFPCYC